MDINKHIVDQRISKIVEENPAWFEGLDSGKRVSQAFVILGVASYLSAELSEAENLLTEGGNDSGVDALYIGDVVNHEFPVIIFQGKYKRDIDNNSNFPANSILRIVSAVNAIFDPSRGTIANDKLLPKIEEIRALIADGYIPSVKCVMINNGLKWNAEGDLHIRNSGFLPSQVSFEHFNHQNIVEMLKVSPVIDDTVTIVGKGIVEEFNFKRVLIGRLNVSEIAALMRRHGDALLEKNIRKYLGLRKNRVNEGMVNTLTDHVKKANFYFFNNGITMVCSKFRHNALSSENWQVKIDDMQIINGGQTCKTIWQTIEDNSNLDLSNVFVLLRLYEIPSDDHEELITDITLATNSQNPVDLRDLRANETLQKDLEIAVKQLGYTYKRKREGMSVSDAIPSSVAAEAVFSIWRKKPHLAKFRRSELFNKFYEEIFRDLNAAQLIIAVLIFRYSENQRKKEELFVAYPHLSYSSYFLSMLIGEELLRSCGIKMQELTHRNFEEVKRTFEEDREALFNRANARLIDALDRLYCDGYAAVDLRRLAAAFRRGDLLAQLQG